jgi:dTDP-4-amino-4,6-dideoxygalactose transaminase
MMLLKGCPRCGGDLHETVDLYGRCADYDRLLPLAEHHEVPVLEDAAEALGATHPRGSAGTLGQLGVLSFNGNKIATTSGGGAIVTDDPDVAARARHLATQARDPAPHYEHSTIGYNYRLSNLLAAVGRGQLRRLDELVARRRDIHAAYVDRLGGVPGVTFAPIDAFGRSNCWLTVVTIDPEAAGADRETIREHLDRRGIEARPVWKPMHLQPVFAEHRIHGGELAARLFRDGLCLPSGSALTDEELDEVASEMVGAVDGDAGH